MTKNEIVGRLKAGGLDASSTNRNVAVYVADAMAGRAVPGWFAYRIVCDSEATERRARAILSLWYDIDTSGNVWRLRSKNRVPLMAIKRGATPPTPPTPTGDYMYFEAVQSNSTVSLMSTLATAPNLEYSTDGETWQEWHHTTTTEDEVTTHVFDTLTLTAVGDRVYLRGDNPNGLNDFANEIMTSFHFSGKINAGGSVTSILDGDGVSMTALPDNAITVLFGGGMLTQTPDTSLLTAPSFGNVTYIGDFACSLTYAMCTALQTPPSMAKVTTIGDFGCGLDFSAMGSEGSVSMGMFYMCSSLSQPAGLTNVTYLGVAGLSGFYAGCHSLTSPDSIAITEIPNYGCSFMYAATAVSACMSMDNIISIGDFGCGFMYHDLDGESMNITSAADMNSVLTMGDGACSEMYLGCPISDPANMGNVSTFGKAAIDSMYGYEGGSVTLVSDGQLTFDFPELPVTLGAGTPDEETLSTAQDVADYMTYVG